MVFRRLSLTLSLAFFGALVVAMWAAPASADVLPVDVQACEGLASGAECTNGGTTGFCTTTTCTRFVRADGSSSTAMDYACLRCIPGSSPPRSCTAGVGQSGSAGLAILLSAIAAIALARRMR